MVETRVDLTADLWAAKLVDLWVVRTADMKDTMMDETRELK
jgi:hypothetical protein